MSEIFNQNILKIFEALEKEVIKDERKTVNNTVNNSFRNLLIDSIINIVSALAIFATFFFWDFAKELFYKYFPETSKIILNISFLKPLYSVGIFRIIRMIICFLALYWIFVRTKNHIKAYKYITSIDLNDTDTIDFTGIPDNTDFCISRFNACLSADTMKEKYWFFPEQLTNTEKVKIGGYLGPGAQVSYNDNEGNPVPFREAYIGFWKKMNERVYKVYYGIENRDDVIADIMCMNTPLGDLIHKILLTNISKQKAEFTAFGGMELKKEIKEFDMIKAKEEAMEFLKEKDNYYLWRKACKINLISEDLFKIIRKRLGKEEDSAEPERILTGPKKFLSSKIAFTSICIETILTLGIPVSFLIWGYKPFMEAFQVFRHIFIK